MAEWRCDTCGAAASEPCRGVKSGKQRPIIHLGRWITGWVYTRALLWLPRLSARERFELAAKAMTRADLTEGQPPQTWTDVTELLTHTEQLQRAVVRHIDLAEKLVDITELRRDGLALATAMHEAGDLLRRLHTQVHEGEEAVAAPMVLPESDGEPRTYLSLAELRAARDLGLVNALTADMNRRDVALADQAPSAVTERWAVHWEESGRFHAELVPVEPVVVTVKPGGEPPPDPPRILGWAAHHTAVQGELGWWSVPPRPAEVDWQTGRPEPALRLNDLTDTVAPLVSQAHAVKAFWAAPEHIAELQAAIDVLRRDLPIDRIREEVTKRAQQLRAASPKLPDLVGPLTTADPYVLTTTPEWIPTRAIVHSVDDFSREFETGELEQIARAIPELTQELLAVPYAEVPGYLADRFTRNEDAVELLRIPAPGGPLYTPGESGAHVTHLCRILGLPWMFASTTLMTTPRRVVTTDVTPAALGPEAAHATAELWRGLIERGVMRGELTTLASDWEVEVRLDYVPAPWLLLPAERANLYNQRYESLYPGALATAGIPADALEGPSSWRVWLSDA